MPPRDEPLQIPPQVPVVIPGHGVLTWAAGVVAPPAIVTTHGGVSATWTELRPDGTRAEFTVASADGRSFPPPIELDRRLLLRYATFDPAQPAPSVPEALASGPDTTIHIVQFTGALVPGMLQDLIAAGATPRAYLPNFAYIATIPPERMLAVSALPCVRAVVAYHPAYRLDEAVLARVTEDRKNSANAPSLYNIQTLVPGPSLKAAVVDAVTAAGGTLVDMSQAGSLVRALLTPAQVLAVVRNDAVLFMDDSGPPSCDMDIVRHVVGANFIQDTLGFTGQGVRAMVVDDNLRASHSAFQSPPVTGLTPRSGDVNHGTSCYGIIFGSGAAFAPGRGLMPNAQQGFFADFDFMPDRVALAISASDETNRCVLQSNSWGHPWTYGYTIDSYEMDLAAFLSGMLIVQSQSNSGGQWSRPEAWAKNALSVGGITHYGTPEPEDDCYCGFASIGPAADGRVKPDVALHNDQIGTTTGWGDQAYTPAFGGTSAAAAGISGCAGLVYEMWHEGVFAGFGGAADVYASRPAAATVRALLINTAYRYDFFAQGDKISRFRQGWGIPRLDRLYKVRQGMLIVDQSIPLQAGQGVEFPFLVPSDTAELTATMAYRDPPGTTSSLVHRINDLTLIATSPGGIVYYGNAGLMEGNLSTPGGAPDTRNVIENLFISDPEPGTWLVRVYASEVNGDSRIETPELDADFSLVLADRIVNYCEADWNRDQTVNSTDVSDFINDWFLDQLEGTIDTDVDHNGVVNSTDVSAFINSYFDAIAGGCG